MTDEEEVNTTAGDPDEDAEPTQDSEETREPAEPEKEPD
jgi:hypothetical protein